MKVSIKSSTALFSLFFVIFLTFSFSQKANAKLFIPYGTINGTIIHPHCGDLLRYPSGSNLTLSIVVQDDAITPSTLYVSAPEALLAVSTFDPPLPHTGFSAFVVNFACPLLPELTDDMVFISYGGICGEETCTIHFDLPLSVELSSFISIIYENDVKLNWTTTTETNNKRGKEVATIVNGAVTAGYYTINFNASNFASGTYFYRINAEGNGNAYVMTKKIILLK